MFDELSVLLYLLQTKSICRMLFDGFHIYISRNTMYKTAKQM